MNYYFSLKMWHKTGRLVLPLCHSLMTQSVKPSIIYELWDKVMKKSLPSREALDFCQQYKLLENNDKKNFLCFVANEYGIVGSNVKKAANAFLLPQNCDDDAKVMLNAAEKLKISLEPKYSQAFNTVSSLEGGIKFLVDFRADLLELLGNEKKEDLSFSTIKAMSNHLKDVLSFCFSIGFLTLERITWDSSCHMLQKISEYEAVHPVKNWTDLKHRVGLYRRCYVFTHSSMPSEPIVMLHTALTEEISSHITDIVVQSGQSSTNTDESNEDEKKINAAIFYSITSTQAGLRGIELGNQLIKKVVGEILKEFPHILKFSSLSPIPGFKEWLLVEMSKAKEGTSILPNMFSAKEISSLGLSETNDVFWKTLSQAIASNRWISNLPLKEELMKPLMRSCAHYLFNEKRRSYALNSVAHFHLRNGAVLWRLNWAADLSPRGLDNSCGIMVNYRYFMDETEQNSQSYNHDYYIKMSNGFKELLTP